MSSSALPAASSARNSSVLALSCIVAQRLELRLERIDCGDLRPIALQATVVGRTEDPLHHRVELQGGEHFRLSSVVRGVFALPPRERRALHDDDSHNKKRETRQNARFRAAEQGWRGDRRRAGGCQCGRLAGGVTVSASVLDPSRPLRIGGLNRRKARNTGLWSKPKDARGPTVPETSFERVSSTRRTAFGRGDRTAGIRRIANVADCGLGRISWTGERTFMHLISAPCNLLISTMRP